MSEVMKSLFIMSSERSGSNLLRMMLGSHSALSAPPPPHLWRHMTEALPSYGPLTCEDNFRRIVKDAVDMTQYSYSHLRWKHSFSTEQILERTTSPTLGNVITSLYDAYAEKEEASGWICKENHLFNHAHQIREHRPHAQFIYLSRDGRDVACSIRDMPTHDQHIYPIAKEWASQQKQCLRVHQEIQQKNDSLLLRYEDLITSPGKMIKKICSFADVEYQERMLYFHETDEAIRQAKKSEYWENLSNPIMSDNKGKFLQELSEREIAIFESVAGDILDLLGYPISTPPGCDLPIWRKAGYRIWNAIQTFLKKQELSDWEGREERKAMLNRIHNRSRNDWSFRFASPLTYD